MRALLIALLAGCSNGIEEMPEGGCGDGIDDVHEQCDDGNRQLRDGCDRLCQLERPVTVTWQFYPNVGGAVGPCPPTVSGVELVLEDTEPKLFPCAPHQGQVLIASPLQRLFARVIDTSGNAVMSSAPRFVPPSFRSDVAFYDDGGLLRVFIPPPGPTTSCSSLQLRLEIMPIGGTRIVKNISCVTDLDAREGVLHSDPLPAGTYEVTVVSNSIHRVRPNVVLGANNAIADVDFTNP